MEEMEEKDGIWEMGDEDGRGRICEDEDTNSPHILLHWSRRLAVLDVYMSCQIMKVLYVNIDVTLEV